MNLQEFIKVLKNLMNVLCLTHLETKAVFQFCLENKIKLIYSATSASLGIMVRIKIFLICIYKSKKLRTTRKFKKMVQFKYEVIYFYNVYGPKQICKGDMATVIGIFENRYKKNLPLTIVKPGTQTRRFTHIDDTIDACLFAWKKNKCRHYSIFCKKSYSILEVAKLFKSKITYLPPRSGERYASALTDMNLSNKVYKIIGKRSLKQYIESYLNFVRIK